MALLNYKITSFESFKQDTSGNMAITFAVAMLMILACVGAALDFSMAQNSRVKMQNSADSAVLAAASSGKTKQPQLLGLATAAVNNNNQTGLDVTTTLNVTNNGRIRVNVSGQYNTFLLGIFGRSSVNINAVAEAPIGADVPVNIALVLDTTGSMSGKKMASLKKAAGDMITMLEQQKSDDVKVSVIPFAQYVNVGSKNSNAPWIQADAAWQGCAGSRHGNLDEQAAYGNKKIPGLSGVNCGAEILPLTKNLKSARAKIKSFQAKGWTYIPSGLLWGWRTLDEKAPFSAPTNAKSKSRNVIVLMTDGANTRSKAGNGHEGWNQSKSNQKTINLCGNIKSDNIEIYTIAYEITKAKTKTLMQDCATDTSMYFDAANSADLNAAFQEIGKSLVQTRLSH